MKSFVTQGSLKGFTIVELLIVIVVIGILASITVVAFNGVQNRANDTAVKATVLQAMKSINLYKIDKDTYPGSISDCPNPATTNICTAVAGLVYSSPSSIYTSQNSYGVGAIKGSRFYFSSDAEVSSSNEFVQYVDLAPIIDVIGLRSYKLSFDIKSANVATNNQVNVYFQNGSSSKYGGLSQNVTVTTAYTSKSLTFTATNSTLSDTKAILAFYGTYGSGNIPTVTNLRFEPNY